MLAGLVKKCRVFVKNFTYSQLYWGREEVNTSFLGNHITARNTRQVDECGFDDALLALNCFENALRKSATS